jgi:zinc protease
MDTFGSQESVSKLSVDDVLEYYDAYVKPDNMVVAVFGVKAHDEAKSLVEKYFSEFSGKTVLPEVRLDPPIAQDQEVSEPSSWQQAVVFYGFGSCSVSSDDRYALDVLDAVLSGAYSPGGRLHTRLRNNQLVYLVHAYNRLGVDPGWFVIYASSLPKNFAGVQQVIAEEIAKLTKSPPTQDELAIAKGMCVSAELVHRRQTMSQQAAAACLGELYGLGYDSFLGYQGKIEAVSAEDVMQVARKYFTHYVKVTSVPELEAE